MVRLLAIIALALGVAVGLSSLAAWGISNSVLAGAQGPAGAEGPAGPTGPAGPRGPAGAAGAPGSGATGAPGSSGAVGSPGANGTNGADGTDGASGEFYLFGAPTGSFDAAVGGYIDLNPVYNVGPVGTYDLASQVLTIDESGLYEITFTLTTTVDTGTDATGILLRNGGSPLLYSYGPGSTTVTYPFNLLAGDTLAMVVVSSDSSTTGNASGRLILRKVD